MPLLIFVFHKLSVTYTTHSVLTFPGFALSVPLPVWKTPALNCYNKPLFYYMDIFLYKKIQFLLPLNFPYKIYTSIVSHSLVPFYFISLPNIMRQGSR